MPLHPVQVIAASKAQGNDTRETGTDTESRLQGRVAEVAARMNEHLQQMQHSLRFSVDDASGHIVVKVIDTATDEVIRQIPSEEMLAVMRHITDFDGLLFDGRA